MGLAWQPYGLGHLATINGYYLVYRNFDNEMKTNRWFAKYEGGEPKAPPDTPRRSWTQWEYYRATQGECHIPVYRFLARVASCGRLSAIVPDLANRHRPFNVVAGAASWLSFSGKSLRGKSLWWRLCPIRREVAMALTQ